MHVGFLQDPREFERRDHIGTSILREILAPEKWRHFVKRRAICIRSAHSTFEESLLACGLTERFARDSLFCPTVERGKAEPEFSLRVPLQSGICVDFECLGVHEPEVVALPDQFAIRDSAIPRVSISRPKPWRLLHRAAKKKAHIAHEIPTFLVVTYYGAYDFTNPEARILELQAFATDTYGDRLRSDRKLLGVCLNVDYVTQGVWMSHRVASYFGLGIEFCKDLRLALKSSFWPRADGAFFSEDAVLGNCQLMTPN